MTTVTAKLTAWNAAQATVNSGNLQRALQNAQIGLQTAQQTVIDTAVGAKQSDLDAAQRSVDAAQSSVDLATAKYNALFDPPKPENLLPLQASVDQAKATLSTAQLNLVAATITAPFAGQISSLTGEVGSQVGANTAVFILLNPKLIRIDANVDQSDISNLKVGQTATVTFDALTGRTYQGTVSAIGLTPTTHPGRRHLRRVLRHRYGGPAGDYARPHTRHDRLDSCDDLSHRQCPGCADARDKDGGQDSHRDREDCHRHRGPHDHGWDRQRQPDSGRHGPERRRHGPGGDGQHGRDHSGQDDHHQSSRWRSAAAAGSRFREGGNSGQAALSLAPGK